MLSQLTIPKKRTDEPALDHQQLYNIGLKHVQRLASRIWTDYNIHDPGITILELLCYAITDLGYRASFPIKDLLASESDNAENMKKQFFTARQILPNRPLTVLDYRKLLIDLKGIKNAWLEPASRTYYIDTIEGNILWPTLLAGEIENLKSFAEKMVQPSDGISKYLSERLSKVTLRALSKYPDSDQSLLQAALVQELNRIIQGDLIYDADRFASVNLPQEKSTLVVGLNRLLLEDAYPDVIGKNVLLRKNLRLDGIREIKIAGLYDVVIEYMDDIAEDKKDGIKKSVWSTLHKNCNLCEDFVSLTEVETQSFLLCCELDLAPDADVSRVKAEIRFKVQQYLSPPVNNYTLSEMLERKKADGTTYTADEIFDGPALDCGFIDDDELAKADLLTKIRLSDIISIIMDIEGVQSVRDILINPVGTEIPLENKWVVDVASGKKAVLDNEKSRVVFYKRNMPVTPDGMKADEYYNQLTDAATAKAEKKVEEDFDIPLGTHRHSERYYSFQNHFPAVYGISESGLSDAADKKRKALAYQLKAYLLFFDQVMANYFAQLSHTKDLFSTDANLHRTYFYQVVDSFADYNKIYGTGNVVDTIQNKVEGEGDKNTLIDRRNRFLDHLIARFAERFNDLANIMYSAFDSRQEDMITHKCEFLNNYPAISSERSLAYNYSLKDDKDPWNTENVSGLEKRLARLLGIHDYKRRNLGDDEGMYLIENILLRPETVGDPFLPICLASNCTDCAGEDPYSYRIHIILPGENGRFRNMEFRRFAEQVIREETPAHILPKICWISKEDMASFGELYQIFLKAGVETTFIEKLFEVKNVYPSNKLYECDGESDFCVEEFKPPLTKESLCSVINNDSYNIHLTANINTVCWLNELLCIADFYDILHAKKPNLTFSKYITELVEETKEYRNKGFPNLSKDEQGTIKRLNRFLLEESYPQETPKIQRERPKFILCQTALGTVAGRDTKNPTAILKAPSPVEFGMSFTLDGSDSSAVEPRKIEKYIWTMLE